MEFLDSEALWDVVFEWSLPSFFVMIAVVVSFFVFLVIKDEREWRELHDRWR